MSIHLSLKDISKLTPVKANEWRPVIWSGGNGAALAATLTDVNFDFKIPFPVIDFKLKQVDLVLFVLNNGFYINTKSIVDYYGTFMVQNGNTLTGMVNDASAYTGWTLGVTGLYLNPGRNDFNVDFDLGQLAGSDFRVFTRILLNAPPVGATYTLNLTVKGEYRN